MRKATIVKEFLNEKEEMRQAFTTTLIELGHQNEKLVFLDSDLMSCLGTQKFQEIFPQRAINCGIQEANMVSVAAGLSATGKVPFIHSFGPFLTRRVCDQIFVSLAYARLNAKLIGSDAGITAQANGATHTPFEDMGIMRSIPEVIAMDPTDITMMKSLMKQMNKDYGIHYMRLVRKQCIRVYEDHQEFKIGEACLLKEGSDVTLIASGYCVAEALKAAETLEAQGISTRVIDIFTWKPIDEEAIIDSARETGAIVTCENHNIKTGLASAVSEVVVKNHPVPMEFIGVNDQFSQVGTLDFLAKTYGLDADSIVKAAQKVVARKKG